MRPLITSVILTLSACSQVSGGEYLERYDEGLLSTHNLGFIFKSTGSYSLHGPIHRTDRFNEVPYGISLAAYLSEDAAVMIHAEEVLDGSGASDYSHLDASSWPVEGFRQTEAACFTLADDDIDGEHDLEWLRSEGFDPQGTLAFQQFFASSEDFNDEVVISILVRAESCPEEGLSDILAPVQASLTVEPAEE